MVIVFSGREIIGHIHNFIQGYSSKSGPAEYKSWVNNVGSSSGATRPTVCSSSVSVQLSGDKSETEGGQQVTIDRTISSRVLHYTSTEGPLAVSKSSLRVIRR
jgi:hypothetical protein